MRKFYLVLLMVGALGFVLAGCMGTTETKDDTKTEKTDEPAKEEPKKDEPKKDEGGGGGGPCDKYAKCCNDYADAIGKLDGITEDVVKMTKDSCAQIEDMKATPGADQACQTALDAMKQGAEAYKAMPGFSMPDSCS